MKIAVVGFGIQGRAQALNLRDSGYDVVIANREDEYRSKALEDGFDVLPIEQAVHSSDVILLLIPDAHQNKILTEVIFKNMKENSALVFAHGYWLTYEGENIPNNIDIMMIAPRFPGEPIRKTYLEGGGVPAYINIFQDSSGKADKKLNGLTEGLGFSKGGLIELTPRQETVIDLFIEQFMAPTFFASAESAFELLVEEGYPEEAVCLELYYSGELGAVRTMMGRDGLYKGFQNNASPTCQYGVSSSRKLLWGEDMKEKAKHQLKRIMDGTFHDELSDNKNAKKKVEEFVESDIAKKIKKIEKKVDQKINKYL